MHSDKNILAIIRYAKSRYGLDISNSENATVIKAAAYLARSKQDNHLARYVSDYSIKKESQQSMIVRKSIPILKKSVSVSRVARARVI